MAWAYDKNNWPQVKGLLLLGEVQPGWFLSTGTSERGGGEMWKLQPGTGRAMRWAVWVKGHGGWRACMGHILPYLAHPLCGQCWWHCLAYADHGDPDFLLLVLSLEPKPFPLHSAVRHTKAKGGTAEHLYPTSCPPATLGHSLFIHCPKVHFLPGLPYPTYSSWTSWGCPVDHHTQQNPPLPEKALINQSAKPSGR